MTKNRVRKLVVFVLLCLFFLPYVSAELTPIFREDTQSQLKRPCFDSGDYCDSTFTCNITITRSDGTSVIENQQMTRNPTYYNLTLTPANINTSGIYNNIMSCTNVTVAGEDTFTFVVNPQGIQQTEQRTNSMTRTIFFFGFLALLLFIGGFRSKFMPVRLSLFVLAAILVLVSLNIVSVSLQDEVVNPNILNLMDTLVASTFYLYWFAGGLLFVVWFITAIAFATQYKQKRRDERLAGF